MGFNRCESPSRMYVVGPSKNGFFFWGGGGGGGGGGGSGRGRPGGPRRLREPVSEFRRQHRISAPIVSGCQEDESMAAVARLAAEVSRMRAELDDIMKPSHKGQRPAAGKAVYRCKVASNELMSILLELDSLTVVGRASRRARRSLINAINKLLDSAGKLHDGLAGPSATPSMVSEEGFEPIDRAEATIAVHTSCGTGGSRFSLNRDASLAHLCSALAEASGCADSQIHMSVLRYHDDEDELCMLSTDEDLCEAIRISATTQPAVLRLRADPPDTPTAMRSLCARDW